MPGRPKLTAAAVREIRRDKRASRKIAPVYGVCYATICQIRRWQTWKTVKEAAT